MRSIFVFARGPLGGSLQSRVLLTSKRYIELTTELNKTRDAKSIRKLAREPILR